MILNVILLIIIFCLAYALHRKQKIDVSDYEAEIRAKNTEFSQITEKVNEARQKYKGLQEAYEYEQYKLDECKKDLQAALDVYQEITDNKLKELNASIEEQRQKRQEELNHTLNETKDKYDLQLKEYAAQRQKETEEICDQCIAAEQQYFEECSQIKEDTENLRQLYESLLEPIKQYSKEYQEKLFYTIQLPEEYQEDIEFLLTSVAQKVQHPDIISKLVWAEYVKPNLDETFKRIEIKTESGIYKLTSLIDGKCYIGKSTDVKKRVADHFKAAIGIKSIADQAIHHAILKQGFWNWQIEIITYCDKDKLNELEKYYIEFFKSQEFGYNKNSGGGG